jgi:hypothetical protein
MIGLLYNVLKEDTMSKVEIFEYKATTHFAEAVADRLAFLGYNVVAVVSKVSFKGPSMRTLEQDKNDYYSHAHDIVEHGILWGHYQGYNVEWTIGLPNSYYSVIAFCKKIRWFDYLEFDHCKIRVPEMDIYTEAENDISDFYGSIPQLRKDFDEVVKDVSKRMSTIYSGGYDGPPAFIEDPENEIEKFSNMLREILLSYTKDEG